MRKSALSLVLLLAACGDAGGSEDGTGSSGAPATTGGPATTGDVADGTADSSGDTGVDPPTTGASEDDSGDGSGDTGDTATTGEPVGPMGHFIAVGDGGRRIRSADGEIWDTQIGSGLLDEDKEEAPPDALRALALGDDFLVAVGGGGNFFKGNSMVMRSTDGGVTWQEDLLKDKPDYAPHKLYGVAVSGQTLVAVGMRGKRIRSEDGGVSWSDISIEDQNSRLLAVAAKDSTFVVVGWTEDSYEAPKTSAIHTSLDLGLTWNPADESFARLDAIASGNGAFVSIGAEQCLRSLDGVTWEACGLLSTGYKGVSFAGGEFVLTTAEGLVTSLDGLAWTTPTLPALGSPAQLVRGYGRYVGVRWTDRGWADELGEWNFVTYAAEPMRAVVFVPAT